MTRIPPIDTLLTIYGIRTNPTKSDYSNVELNMDKNVYATVVPLAGDQYALDNKNELAMGLLLSTNAEIVSTPEAKKFSNSLSDKEVVLHSIFLIRDLARQCPGKADFYKAEEEKFAKMLKLSKKEIDSYCLDTTKQYLQEYCKDNKFVYFTYYTPGTTQISPEMNLILQYLTCSPADRPQKQKQIIAMFLKLQNNCSGNDKDPKDIKYRECVKLLREYHDIYAALPE